MRERRSLEVEIRARGRRLEGYAALYGIEAAIGGEAGFVETIAPGAFARSLGRDVLALVDHDPSRLLARTKSGTLRLAEDSTGLSFDLDLPDTSLGRDLLALAERRDVGGMSFGFTVPAGGDEWRGKARTLKIIDLAEISVVQAWPAYEGTVVHARSLDRRPPSRLALARRWLESL